MNHTQKPTHLDDCRGPSLSFSTSRKTRRALFLSSMPLLATYCISLPACAQSPWSTTGRQAQVQSAQNSSPAHMAGPAQASPSDLIVRGQEPTPGTLVSTSAVGSAGVSGGTSASAASDQASFREFDAGELVAVVGTEHVLAGDMMVFIEPILEKNRDKMTPEQEKQVKAKLIRDVLAQYVEIKAMYQEFFRDMVGNKSPKEVEEMQAKVTMKAAQIFHDKQIPVMMKKYKVDDLASLERKLHEHSLSIATLQNQFTERVLSSELERKYVPDEYEFSREELWAYYQEHDSEWNVTSRARYRELCVRFSKHSREEAEALIKDLGNQVYLGGTPFEAVAKQSSEGATAPQGGVYDWINQGSLKSAAIDQAVFSLPLRRLSQVIESEYGFHIIEVLERELGHKKTFDAVQPEIRKKLSNEKRSKLLDEFHKKIMARTSIWTLWPQDIPNSRALSEALGDVYEPTE
ncbi:MAG: peptidylprolyl isomerase [Pirellulaceae bacterium]|nr:peptidylprolyl isomerase [Pirellulaceae bacterium]